VSTSTGGPSFTARVLAGERVVGTFVKLADPGSVDLAAAAGLDFCVVDAEHSQLTRGDVSRLVRHAAATGFPAVVRLPVLDHGEVNRVVEAGASGVQLSGLRSATTAAALRSAMRFPPEGARSVSLAQPAAGYGARALADYLLASATDPPLVVGQIESATTDDPLDDVLGPLDVAFVGTTDLSVDLGVPGEVEHPAVVARIEEIASSAEARGIRVGGWTSTAAEAATLHARGASYLVIGSDLQLLRHGMAALATQAKGSS
jgi:4-hydroxy-2-oxoheptanedioate aldolase